MEILEIRFVFNFLVSWNYWKLDFSIFSCTGTIGKYFFNFWYPGNAGGGRAAPLVKFSWLGLFLEHGSWIFSETLEILETRCLCIVMISYNHDHTEPSGSHSETSHMRPIQGQKQKPIFLVIWGLGTGH